MLAGLFGRSPSRRSGGLVVTVYTQPVVGVLYGIDSYLYLPFQCLPDICIVIDEIWIRDFQIMCQRCPL